MFDVAFFKSQDFSVFSCDFWSLVKIRASSVSLPHHTHRSAGKIAQNAPLVFRAHHCYQDNSADGPTERSERDGVKSRNDFDKRSDGKGGEFFRTGDKRNIKKFVPNPKSQSGAWCDDYTHHDSYAEPCCHHLKQI